MKGYFLLFYKSLQVVESEFDSRGLNLERSQSGRWASKILQCSRKVVASNAFYCPTDALNHINCRFIKNILKI